MASAPEAGGSNSCGGAAGGEGGGDGSRGDQKPSTRARRVTSTPRQSTQVQLQLKVIRQALERLMSERDDLSGIEEGLHKSLDDLDREILIVERMTKISNEAMRFQHGLPYIPVIPGVKQIEGPPPASTAPEEVDEEIRGPSTSFGAGAAAAPDPIMETLVGRILNGSLEAVKRNLGIMDYDISTVKQEPLEESTSAPPPQGQVQVEEGYKLPEVKVTLTEVKSEPDEAAPNNFSDSD